MWKLTIEDDEGKQTGLPLAHDEYGLGRAEANAIRLTDRNVSRKHAMLAKNGQGWFVKDCDSYNGTYVNGVRVVGEQPLRHADLIQLGDYRLELLDESLSAAVTSPAPAPGRGTTLSPLHTRPNRLVMVVGPTPGAEFSLDGERLMIGRSEDAQVSINHSSVSRQHAELISLGGGRFEVIDKQSANGIRINGVELRRGLLEAGDALELGDVRLRFVGAGKIFRTGVDTTLQPAVSADVALPSRNGSGPVSGERGSGPAKLVAVLLVVLLLAGAALFAMTRPPPPRKPDVQPVTAVPDKDALTLDKAKELAPTNLEGAHELLQSTSEASAVRDDPAFKDIEAKWAEMMFEKAKNTPLPTDKFEILTTVASTSSVDKARRDKAILLVEELRVTSPDLPPLPERVIPREPGGAGQQPAGTGTGTAAQPGASASPSAKGSSEPAAVTPGSLESSSYEKQKKALEPKVWSGKASVDEIKLLKAICTHLGDRACRERAQTMLVAAQKAATQP